MDSASKITLNFLSVVLLNFIKLTVLYKDTRRPKYVIQCFTAQRVSIKAHLRTKDFEKFREILAPCIALETGGSKQEPGVVLGVSQM